MTHTLHRRGAMEDLREDYVLLIIAASEIHPNGSEEKMKQIWEILSQFEPDLLNYGNQKGNHQQQGMETLKNSPGRNIHAVFKDQEKLKACLREIKNRQFGLSTIISGIYEDVEKICKEVGLAPHTVNHSLGILGKTEKLPEENVLEITTLCGHDQVSSSLVRHVAKEIREGKICCGKAAQKLCRLCECGVFNPHRAEKILKRMTCRE